MLSLKEFLHHANFDQNSLNSFNDFSLLLRFVDICIVFVVLLTNLIIIIIMDVLPARYNYSINL